MVSGTEIRIIPEVEERTQLNCQKFSWSKCVKVTSAAARQVRRKFE